MGLLKPTTPRTGMVLFDAVLCALEAVSCTAIVHNGVKGKSGSFIRCTYEGKAYKLDYSARPKPGKVTTCIDAFRVIGLMPPDQPLPPRRRRKAPDPGASEQVQPKKRKRVFRVKEVAHAA